MSAGHATSTPPAMRKKGFLLCTEAARKIRVSPQTIYSWLDQSKVRGFRAGYRRYVRWSTVLSYLGPDACSAMGLRQECIWDASPHR